MVRKYCNGECDKYEIKEILALYMEEYYELPEIVLKNARATLENAKAREAFINQPKCPTCNSRNIKKISATSKVADTAVFGVFGTKRHKTFHCNNCGYQW